MKYIQIQVIKIRQNIGVFYVGKITPKNLLTIANDSLSRMKDAEEGIQRDKDPKKVKEIKEYIEKDDATFPNTIIISIQNDVSELDEPNYILNTDQTLMKIKLDDAVANILDGQHRVAGFGKNEEKFELPISIFLDLSLGAQAKIFAQINSTQKKVSLDLVYELFGITEERSYEKTAYYIVNHLNTEESSAWFKKIKTLSESGDLAQGSMAKYIHKNLIDKNKVLHELYNKKRDTDIKNIIKNYFNAIKDVFPIEWSAENVLTKTTGFNGFSIFMIDLIRIAKQNKQELSVDYFKKYINRVRNKFSNFTSDDYESGAKGQNKIRDVLREGLSKDEKELLKIKL